MAKKKTGKDTVKRDSYEHFNQLLDICKVNLKENSSFKTRLSNNYKDYYTFKENIKSAIKDNKSGDHFDKDEGDELGTNIDKISKSDIQDLKICTGFGEYPEDLDGFILSFCLIKSKEDKVLSWIIMPRFSKVEF